jgi:hypothetical protein
MKGTLRMTIDLEKMLSAKRKLPDNPFVAEIVDATIALIEAEGKDESADTRLKNAVTALRVYQQRRQVYVDQHGMGAWIELESHRDA